MKAEWKKSHRNIAFAATSGSGVINMGAVGVRAVNAEWAMANNKVYTPFLTLL